jgi:hypothetical protein
MQAVHRRAGHVAATTRGRAVGLVCAGVMAVLVGLIVALGEGRAATTHPAPRELARAGSFDFVVHRVDTTDVLADPEYPEHNITAAGEFVVVKVTATNVSGIRQTFRSAFDTVSDGVVEYDVVEAARRYVGQDRRDVDPGKSIDAAIVFDVPKGSDLASIVLRDRRFAEGVAVAL